MADFKELLFLWVQNYKNISNQGFCFTSRFKIEYDFHKKTLHIKDNPNFVENFFNHEESPQCPIVNITAIIGKNGSGKTSVLEVLRGATYRQCFYVIGNFNTANDHFSPDIFHYEHLEPERVYRNDLLIELSQITFHKTSTKKEVNINKDEPISGFKTIFYSPIFKGEASRMVSDDSSYSQKNIYDISTDNLVNESLFDVETKHLQSKLIPFKEIETKKNLQFLLERGLFNIVQKYIKTPESLSISPYDFFHHFFKLNRFTSDKLRECCEKLFELLGNYRIIDLGSFFVDCVCMNEIYDLVLRIDNSIKKSEEEQINKIYEILKVAYKTTNLFYEESKPFEGILKRIIYSEVLNEFTWGEYTQAKIEYFLKSIEEVVKRFSNIIVWNKLESRVLLTIPTYNENLQFINEQIKMCPDQYARSVSLKWTSLSSGELSFLNLFSRFHSIYNHNHLVRKEFDSSLILILIDEGEIYLHPQWKKQFIDIITQFFAALFKSSVQIILTTNDPILISDLPSDNVIFLRNDNEKCEVYPFPIKDHFSTFGANIHTLYTESFFMEDGLIGNFASKKINRVIEDLLSAKKLTKTRQEEITKIISLVGEPLIRHKLSELFDQNDKLSKSSKLNELEQRISDLEKRIPPNDTDKK